MSRADDPVPRFLLYGEPPGDAELRFIHVETIAARGSLHNWEIGPHRHDALHQLLLVQMGGGTLRADATVQPFTAPALVNLPPTIVHAFSFAPQTQGWVLTISEGFLAEARSGMGEPPWLAAVGQTALWSLDPTALAEHRLPTLFTEIDREFRWSALGRTHAIAAHLKLLLLAIGRLAQAAGDPHPSRFDALSLVGRFRRLVEASFTEHCPITAYADQLAITAARLNQVCRRTLGCSPLAVVHARLVLEAKRHLVYTSMSVREVGFALGFDDPAYFSRFFTKRAGATPEAFRRHHRDNATG